MATDASRETVAHEAATLAAEAASAGSSAGGASTAHPAPVEIAAAGQLGDVLERVSDALVALDRDWRYTYVNHRAAELFGRNPEDLVGKHIWTEFPEGIGQPFQLAYERAMAEQTSIRIENYYAPWDRWFENRIYPSPDGVSIFFHEITERKRAEDAAEAYAALLAGQNQVLEHIARGEPLHRTLDTLMRVVERQCPGLFASILLLDEEGTRVRHGAAPSLPDDFVRAIDGSAIGPAAGSCGTAAFRRQPVIVEDIETDSLWDEYRALALRSGVRSCWSVPILDRQGDVLGTFALYLAKAAGPTAFHWKLIGSVTHTAAIAITRERQQLERRRVEEERHTRELQLAEAQRVAQLGSYEWDIRSNAVSRSDELARIFGVSLEQFEPTLEGYLARVHPEDRENTRRIIEHSYHARCPFEFEERIVRPDGAVRLLRSRGSWTCENGQPVRLLGICQDITDRRKTEHQLIKSQEILQRNQELKAFAYTVSHDLKAPLRGIAGYAQELDRRHQRGLDERARFCVDRILLATRNLDRLIEDLLEYSRLDAETPTATTVDLTETIEGILRDRRPTIPDAAEIVVTLAVTTIRVWRRGLLQVLANLIDNALKYSQAASPPRIRIGTERRADAVRITVADNGIGFDPKYQDRIFGLFNRLVRQEDFEGTGAGLAIVRKITDKMQGAVWAESAPGAGATFYVELPTVVDEAG
jgi:PAS domain S-box-containing protein